MRHAWLSQLLICHSQLEAPTSGEHWSPDFPPFSNQVKSKRAYPCTTTPGFLALPSPPQPSLSCRLEPRIGSKLLPFLPNPRPFLLRRLFHRSSYYRCTGPPCPALPCPAQPSPAPPTSGAPFSPVFPADSSKRPILPNPTQSASSSYPPLKH